MSIYMYVYFVYVYDHHPQKIRLQTCMVVNFF